MSSGVLELLPHVLRRFFGVLARWGGRGGGGVGAGGGGVVPSSWPTSLHWQSFLLNVVWLGPAFREATSPNLYVKCSHRNCQRWQNALSFCS